MADKSKNIRDVNALDLIFKGRNKDYGAYRLRQMYISNLRKAFLYTMGVVALLLAVRFVQANVKNNVAKEVQNVVVEMKDVPSIDPNTPPPPPPPKVLTPPPKRPSVKYVPPVVKKDEEVVDTVKLATFEELEEADVGKETVEGDPDSEIPADIPSDIGDDVGVTVKEEPKPLLFAEQMPSYPGGQKKLFQFINDHIKYPAIARENGVEGNVTVQFVVSSSGKISGIKVLRDIGAGCGAEAVRVVKKMPKWLPGKQNGKPVSVQMTLPVRFVLQ